MSKELDKLIEQVLSEKNTFSVDVTNRLSPSDPSEEEEDETVRKDFGLGDRAKVKDPTKTGDDGYTFRVKDLMQGFGATNAQSTGADALSRQQAIELINLIDDDGSPNGNKRRGHFFTDKDFQSLFTKTEDGYFNIAKQLFKIFFTQKPKYAPAGQFLPELVNLYVGSAMQKAKDKNLNTMLEVAPRAALFQKLATNAAQTIIGDEPDNFGLGSFGDPMRGSEVSPGTKGQETTTRFDQISSSSVTLDPMLKGIFKEFEDMSLKERFEKLEEFSKIFAGDKDPQSIQAALVKWQKDNEKNQFETMNYVFALTLLADQAKKQSSSNAGAFLEGYLNYFIGAPSLGAMGAATDNIAKLLDSGQPVYTSAKFYVRGSDMSQKLSNLQAEVKKNGAVYYIVVGKSAGEGKTGKGSEYQLLEIFVMEIKASKESKTGLQSTVLKADFTPQGSQDVIRPSKKRSHAKIDPWKYKPTFTVAALPETFSNIGQDQKATLDQIFVSSVESATDRSLEVVKKITANITALQELDYRTKKLPGDVQRDSSDNAVIQNKVSIMKRFTALQDTLKTGYADIFRSVGEITESKSPIDQLIEAIIKQTLLK
jgi:hypothetical protein